jgi:dihydrolipoamide dehydrogenase
LDLIVIGGGPGGYTAAIRASQLGMKVACVEKDATLGGTCLNVGCIPSKALLDSSEKYDETRQRLARHGVRVGAVELDLPAMMARKADVVQGLTRGVAGLFRKNKIEFIQGFARLTGPTSVQIETPAGSRVLETRHILIATGSAAVELPALPFDGKYILSSTEALSLTEVPRRLVVIGAGAVGLELGSVWSRLGSAVLVVEFQDRILPGSDREMSTTLQKALEKQGLRFRLGARAQSFRLEGQEIRLVLARADERSELACDRVLVAVGRRPFTDGLGLEALGVRLDSQKRIHVDSTYLTDVPTVSAIGDVIAGPMLAHKASEEGVAAVERLAGKGGGVNYLAIPNIVYTHPELASVGLTEEQAQTAGHPLRVGRFPMTASPRGRCMGETEGLVKVIGDARTDRLLGVHVVAPRASDWIAEAVVAMEFASSVEDLARSVHAHPTMPEALKEAALAATGEAINI